MPKRGQITLFLIIGLAIIFAAGVFLLLNQEVDSNGFDGEDESKVLLAEKDALKQYVESCLEVAVNDGIQEEGLDEERLANFIEDDLYRCVDMSRFEKRGIDTKKERVISEVAITPGLVLADVNFKATLSKGDSLVEVSVFTYALKRRVVSSVQTDGQGVTDSEIIIRSSDQLVELSIPENTQITDSSGNPVENPEIEILLEALDSRDATIYGYKIYKLEPAGLQFSNPIFLKIQYDDEGMGTEEESLKIVKRADNTEIWKTIPTVTYSHRNVAVGRIESFSEVGVSITCASPRNDKVFVDTEFMYLSDCEPCRCFGSAPIHERILLSHELPQACHGETLETDLCVATEEMQLHQLDADTSEIQAYEPRGGTIEHYKYSNLEDYDDVGRGYCNAYLQICLDNNCGSDTLMCREACRKVPDPIPPDRMDHMKWEFDSEEFLDFCESEWNRIGGNRGCFDFDWNAVGLKYWGLPMAEAAGGKGEFEFSIGEPGDCIDTVGINSLLVNDTLDSFEFNGNELLTGVPEEGLYQHEVDIDRADRIITEEIKTGENRFEVKVHNLEGACAYARMLFNIRGAGLECEDDPDEFGQCCAVINDQNEWQECDFPIDVFDVHNRGFGGMTAEPGSEECTEVTEFYGTHSVKEFECSSDICSVFERPDKVVGTGEECSGDWCCDAEDTVSCCVKDDKIFFRAESYDPYTWVAGALNGESIKGVTPDDEDGGYLLSDYQASGGTRWWWIYEYDLTELEEGVNIFSFLKDACFDSLYYETKKCVRTAFNYENGELSPVAQDFEFPEEELETSDLPTMSVAPPGGFAWGGQVMQLDGGTIEYMNAACMNWVKHQVRINDINEDPAKWDHLINDAHENGYNVLLSVLDNNPNQINPSGDYFEKYADYVAALAERGADAVEIWNEPNIDREWPAGSIDPDLYTQLLQKSYGKIKQANPETIVISAAPAPTGFFGGIGAGGWDDIEWINGLQNAGAEQYADCIGVHYNSGATAPDQTSGHPNGDHYTWYFPGMVETYSQVFTKPLCFTELGYATDEDMSQQLPDTFSWAEDITVQNQADWLSQVAGIASQDDRINMVIVWNMNFQNNGNDPMGAYAIIRPDRTCPACEKLKGTCGGSSQATATSTTYANCGSQTGWSDPGQPDPSPDDPDTPQDGACSNLPTLTHECTQRCELDPNCQGVRGGHYPYCGKTEGHCVQCWDAVTVDGRKLGCEPGISCDSRFNWCRDTHYHQIKQGDDWITLLGDGCNKDEDCEKKFTGSTYWPNRVCDVGRGLCIERCTGAPEGGDVACQNHFGPEWSCDPDLDMCIKNGNKQMSP